MKEIARHFTASGYVVQNSSVLLHWHQKVKEYLPPGGHIEQDEDPVEAVLREVKEETGLSVNVIRRDRELRFQYPLSVASPEHVLVEDIEDPIHGFHQHIDFIYFCSPTKCDSPLNEGWYWFDETALKYGLLMDSGDRRIPPADVQELGIAAIRAEYAF